MYVEFFGQPGSGKSTLHSRAIEFESYYGGVDEDAVNRMFVNYAPIYLKIIYKLVPDKGRTKIDKIIERQFRHKMFVEFSNTYPEFIEILYKLQYNEMYDPSSMFSRCKRTAERFQLSKITSRENEILFLDDVFFQNLFAIMLRDAGTEFPISEFINSVPTPDLLIHVDAPPQLCLNRQFDRNRVTVRKPFLRDNLLENQIVARKISQNLACEANKYTNVLTIKNTGTINSAVNLIQNKIDNIETMEV